MRDTAPTPTPEDTVVGVHAGSGYRIITDPVYGFRRLAPVPTSEALDDFYESKYRDLLDAGGRAPDLARLVGGGEDAAIERTWQAATIHADVVAALEPAISDGLPPLALDVGCGTGELLRVLVQAGWDAIGTEPAAGIADVGRAAGLRIESATAAAFAARWRSAGEEPFTGVVLLNVLEHVPDPVAILTDLLEVLAPGGRLVVRVPNDFSPLQLAAQQALGGDPWWVAVPDHVNYFDHASLAALVTGLGLEVVDRTADFPMELFLLMGDDYRSDPVVGAAAHYRRRRAELALDNRTRRALGRAWAEAGIGRNAIVVARRPA